LHARRALDATVHKVSQAYRTLMTKSRQEHQARGEHYHLLDLGDSTSSSTSSEEGGALLHQMHATTSTSTTTTQTAVDFAIPPELSESIRLLHHLRRGTLLGPPLQSADDRACHRALFLRMPLEDCLCMMAPRMFALRRQLLPVVGVTNVTSHEQQQSQTRPQPVWEKVPAETLLLWDDVMIAADHFDGLFVWSGQDLCLPLSFSTDSSHDSASASNDASASTGSIAGKFEKYDAIRKETAQMLMDGAADRFPAPSLFTFGERDSVARKLTTRLVPSHVDPPAQQVAHLPALAQFLSLEKLEALRAKFSFHDSHVNVHVNVNDNINIHHQSSDPSFRQWFWKVVQGSANKTKREKATATLCE
jgi:hypothetical protein